jgi:glycosyltransferase involved in cell wall biosynthesis
MEIHNPIDVGAVRKFSVGSLNEALRLPGQPALVSVGRLSHQKGYDILLEAFAMMLVHSPLAQLTIIGDGPDRGKLQAMAVHLGIAGAVHFVGFSNNPIPALYGADLFVLASRYEGFCNAILEALAVGLPVVTTSCPGANAEVIREGMNGVLARPSCAADLCAALLRASKQLSFDSDAIREDCRRRFDVSSILVKYENALWSTV